MSEILEEIVRTVCCSTDMTDGFTKGYDVIYRCHHCGDTFLQERYVDAAGSTDTRLIRLTGKNAFSKLEEG